MTCYYSREAFQLPNVYLNELSRAKNGVFSLLLTKWANFYLISEPMSTKFKANLLEVNNGLVWELACTIKTIEGFDLEVTWGLDIYAWGQIELVLAVELVNTVLKWKVLNAWLAEQVSSIKLYNCILGFLFFQY